MRSQSLALVSSNFVCCEAAPPYFSLPSVSAPVSQSLLFGVVPHLTSWDLAKFRQVLLDRKKRP